MFLTNRSIKHKLNVFGRLAQLARAPALQAGCRRFESYTAQFFRCSRKIRTGEFCAVDIISLIKTRRSIRRFSQEKLDKNLLIELVEAARCAPAGDNVQSLEYIIVDEPQSCEKLFACLAWAGHVKPKRNPVPGQRPVAYIVVLADTDIKKNAAVDAAAAIENILLAAWGKKGIGTMMVVDDLKAAGDFRMLSDNQRLIIV